MSKNILSFFGFIGLLVAAFMAGYSYRANAITTENDCPSKLAQMSPTSEVLTPTATPNITISVTPTVAPTPILEKIFDNGNIAAVGNGPTAPTVFTLSSLRKISSIMDYHWNSARGKTAGTIGLKSDKGVVYGPWQAKGTPGQGGVVDAYWTVTPELELPAGTYTIIDSDVASWAQNSGSKGIGMSIVYAVKE